MIQRASFRVTVLCIGVLIACSTERHVSTVSLLDVVSSHELAVPWKLARWTGWIGPIARNAEGIALTKGKMIQTEDVSVVRFSLDLSDACTVVIRVSYGDKFPGNAIAETRVVQSGTCVARASGTIRGVFHEAVLECPVSGSVILELRHHVQKGTVLPLSSVVIGEVDGDAAPADLRELELILEWIADPTFDMR